jgi:hypothetical protein
MGVNVENINRLIEVIGAINPKRFDMSNFAKRIGTDGFWDNGNVKPTALATDCGTCGCIAGWAVAALKPNARIKVGDTTTIAATAAKALGIDDTDAEALFEPYDVASWGSISRRQAIRVLEHLRDTGEVDWGRRGRR